MNSHPLYATLSHIQTGALLKALGNGSIGFDHKKYKLAELRGFIAAWIAQGHYTLDHVNALAAPLAAPAVPPAPSAAVHAVPPAPIAAAVAVAASAIPYGGAPQPAPVAPPMPQPAPQPPAVPVFTVPAAVWSQPDAAQPAAPAPQAPVAPAGAAITAPDVATPMPSVADALAAVSAPAAPHAVDAGSLFADQPEVAAALAAARVRVNVYGHPDAPALDAVYRFDPMQTVAMLLAWSCTPALPVWCGGPKSTGKTDFVRQLAARLGRPFFRVNFTRGTEPSEVIGDVGLVDGATVWKDGPVAAACRTAGAILLLDEVSYANAGHLAALNPILEASVAGGAHIRLPRDGGILTIAPDVCIAAADNTFGHGDLTGEYAQRQALSADFIDRFRIALSFAFLPADVETQVLRARVRDLCGAKLTTAAAAAIIKLLTVARADADKGDLIGAPSLRRAAAFAVLLARGLPAPLAYDLTIVNSAPPESAQALRSIFAGHWTQDADAAGMFMQHAAA